MDESRFEVCVSGSTQRLMWHTYSSFISGRPSVSISNRQAPEYVHFQLGCWGIFPRNWRAFFWLVCSDLYKLTTKMRISYFPLQPKIEVKQKNVEKKALRYWSYELINVCSFWKTHLHTCAHCCPAGNQVYRCIWSCHLRWYTVH